MRLIYRLRDFEESPENIDLYIISQQDILSMSQLKIRARLTRLSNKENRKKWKQNK